MLTDPPVTLRGALVVADLTWRPYGRADPTLTGIDLAVAPGERVLLLGASGSGKSTLLQAMAGLLDDSLGEGRGSVRVDGAAPDAEPGSVGLLLQDPTHALVAEHAGRDAAFGPENRALPPALVRSCAEQALAEVGFPYGADRSSFALSGGETSRLALAGALALQPRVLLLDEPTAMLDATAAATVRAAVDEVATARGLTVVVVEHQVEGWWDWCDRVVVLDRGRVLVQGPPARLLTEAADLLLAAGVWLPGAPVPRPTSSRPTDDALRTAPAVAAGLRLQGVAVDGPDGSRLLADPVTLELAAGEAAALSGPSGVGKSTLMHAVAGLRPPAVGRVLAATPDGWRPTSEVATSSVGLACTVGWLPQHPESSITASTVRAEVLATSEAVFATDPAALAAARGRAEVLLAQTGLAGLADQDPYRLSGGEQRRLALVAALVHRPAVLLLDEPTVGQDRLTWAAVTGLVETARRDGSAVLATTHDPLFATTLGRVVALRPAEVRAAAPVADHRVAPVVEPGAAPAARCNPLALLLVAVAAAVGSFWVDSARVGLATLALTVVASPLAVRRVRPALLRLVPVALAALSVGWSTLLLSRYGWFAPAAFPLAGREITRILCLVVPGALLVGSLRPSTLGDALAQRLHLPHRPVVAGTSALLRVDQLLARWATLGDVRRVRGLGPARSVPARARYLFGLTVALLVGVLRSAQQMALSMDARGFAGARHRTFALPSPWRARDWLCGAFGVLLVTAPVVFSRLL